MGLDVTLCQFQDVDTEAILELSRLCREPWAFEPDAGVRLKVKARELRLPDNIIIEPSFGGREISYPSKKYPKWPPVGVWSSFGTTRSAMKHFTGKDIYFVFPEAKGDPWLFLRPKWTEARNRLVEILKDVQKVRPAEMEDFHVRFIMPEIPPQLLDRVKSAEMANASEIFSSCVAQIEVMIETLDHVLNHERPREFLLRWSA